ncbi:unnamed protein product [Sphagnum troendelagicum]|uniref:Secreted protein n=1 Tax=Sphagnum troendelagicum TaxID=128251 RepID=A0ABP0TS67_9BRYO
MVWAAAMSVTMLLCCCCCCNTATLRPSAPATRGPSLLSCSSTGRGSDGRPGVGRSTLTPARAPRFSHDRGLVAQHPRAGARVLQRQRSPDDWLPATPVANDS